jgi:hypothetical protein
MKEPTFCELCNEELPADFIGKVCADKFQCLGREVELVKAENKKLKLAVKFWNEAWFEGRDILGWLWWHHPAIHNDEQRIYYQNMTKDIK